jgi:predicted metal-binding protein
MVSSLITMAKHALFVCKSCYFSPTQRDYMGERGGTYLFNQLLKLYENWSLKSDFVVKELDCLSACKRPCAVAFTAPNKTSLMFGDLSPLESAEAILQLCEQYYASNNGIVPRQSRPEILQKGILARIPPPPES